MFEVKMKFLVDCSSRRLKEMLNSCEGELLIEGQLCTPLTNYKNWKGVFGADNGCYGGLNRRSFFSFLSRKKKYISRCKFLSMPDIVGNGRRTLELFNHFSQEERLQDWKNKWALVAQDGMEDLDIDWKLVQALFVGGTNKFKDSQAAYDLCRTSLAMGKHTHVGRVNQWKRYKKFNELGCDTCDGSGVSKYSEKLISIKRNIDILNSEITEEMSERQVRILNNKKESLQ